MQLQNVVYFLVWAGVIFFMMRFGCGAHVMGHGHHHAGSGSGDGDPWTPPEKAVDPVCGMSIATQTAKSTVHAGHVFYFCSTECRTKFESDPASYAKARALSPQHEGHRHGC